MTEHSNTSAGSPADDRSPQPHVVAPLTPSQKRERRRDNIKSIVSTALVLLLAPIIAVLLTAFVFQSYQVDGQSMQNTLFNNDRLIIWKTPVTWSHITKHPYVPNRGDIIVFTDPNLSQFGQDPSKQLIKRVIALPGEHVVVANNVVMVYNTEHPDGFNPDTSLPYDRTARDTAGNLDLIVPAGHIFVMGDNRPDSLDSRMFGPVPLDHIIGKLALRVLPVSQAKRF
ncbi:MAG TPA: signal peptidase I [Candidatus Saccharimonadales bacterium]|nr:signal peptidase I [Candidatus Saccharimonadales bacterium]